MLVPPTRAHDGETVTTQLEDEYKLLLPLGEGPRGTLWRAEQIAGSKPVALAQLEAEGPDAESLRTAFLSMAETLEGISSPHVVKVLGHGSTDDGAWMAMELLTGRSFADRMADEPAATVEELLEVAASVLDGLAAVHGAGLVHGDLEPGNVFLVEGAGRPSAKLIGFGLNRAEARAGRVSEEAASEDDGLIRSLAYMSPEQARGDASINASSDLFSFAVILYEALTGRLPFRAESAEALRETIATKRALPLHKVRKEAAGALASAIDRALAPDPRRRFPNAAAMRRSLMSSLIVAPKVAKLTLPVGPRGDTTPGEDEPARPSAPPPSISSSGLRRPVVQPGTKPLGSAPKPVVPPPSPKLPIGGATGGPPVVRVAVPAPSAAAKVAPEVAPAEAAKDAPKTSTGEEPGKVAEAGAEAEGESAGAEAAEAKGAEGEAAEEGESAEATEGKGESAGAEAAETTAAESEASATAAKEEPAAEEGSDIEVDIASDGDASDEAPRAEPAAAAPSRPDQTSELVLDEMERVPGPPPVPGTSPDKGAAPSPPEPPPPPERPVVPPYPNLDLDKLPDLPAAQPVRPRISPRVLLLAGGAVVAVVAVLLIVTHHSSPTSAAASPPEPPPSAAAHPPAAPPRPPARAPRPAPPTPPAPPVAPTPAAPPTPPPIHVTLHGVPDGAHITLDGSPVQGTTLELVHDDATHTIAVTADGRWPWSQRVTATADAVLDVTLAPADIAPAPNGTPAPQQSPTPTHHAPTHHAPTHHAPTHHVPTRHAVIHRAHPVHHPHHSAFVRSPGF